MKGFTRRTDLKKHAYFHTGVKPFKCSICSKTFSRNTNLTKHMKTHSTSGAVKTHLCNKCSKTFVTHIELLRHQKSHEKNHEVAINSPATNQSPQIIKTFHRTDYNSHLQPQPIPVQMHPSSLHQQQNICMKCNVHFNRFEDLSAHMIIIHNLHNIQQQQAQTQSHPHVVMPPNEYPKSFTGLGFYSEQKDFK